MRLILALIMVFSFSVSANWKLDNANSSLNFISTKNNDISETHSFDRFSGAMTSDGALSVSVSLTSVNTMIEIRNNRMREMLFKVSDYPTAKLTAQLPESVLKAKQGEQIKFELPGELTIHGVASPIAMQVSVTKLDANRYSAHTIKPIIINANQFGLKAGVEALQKIAGLANISLAVPVSFSVVLTRD